KCIPGWRSGAALYEGGKVSPPWSGLGSRGQTPRIAPYVAAAVRHRGPGLDEAMRGTRPYSEAVGWAPVTCRTCAVRRLIGTINPVDRIGQHAGNRPVFPAFFAFSGG